MKDTRTGKDTTIQDDLYIVDTARDGVLEAELFEDQILRMHAVLVKKDYTYLWWRSWMWQCLSVKASKFRHNDVDTISND